ncbi:arf-GAP with Rho-GAP domain, ANK repeat and PH domain-containing protein 3 isoform X4 [Synchiropus splendidus]|uniref:arf-GAP with Rho-GAP domain, ANK repeat and PH domain-containing protein 3 isoform X4 n=1 Tax=Synchiropus splendidus TaxID=270530 RepID=UPI00237D8B82|nr:arf-GAP with Rho-GAP domain, ANK repeat and PH domain-containing protein 3 isoform X4 [Synchiropus splendidus]
MVFVATLDRNSTVETFLSAIHLEKYVETFCRAGLLLAGDLTHMDHDALRPLSSQERRKREHAEEGENSPGYSSLGGFPPPPFCGLDQALQPDEDLTISPYASFTCEGEQAPPIISGWLDKLSPQGNYVFQKRFVKFDGKNLMYFSSDKDVYSKGVIPLDVVQTSRPSKENKFEIVTNQRIFVFRVENEETRARWVSTIQDHVRDQLVWGRSRFSCQKHGALELKGTKSKVYVALSDEQIWLYKNEQCFRNRIAITLIEARGATIRDGKNKSFDLITPYRTFSFTAETDQDKRAWMEELQDSIAETLSDYEVAEKIWSNRSNRTCADCRSPNPDWASINLCVVICKNCAGQHRSLGTMVSKVQSLKLDTSVWSNEIVQLFIMVGNDRANEFWAAHLSPADELGVEPSSEERKEFISHKYRDGRYRRALAKFSSQEQLLKVLCSAVAEQTLLKTVTHMFLEAGTPTDPHSHQVDKQMDRFCSGAHMYRCSRMIPVLPVKCACVCSEPGVYDEITQPVLLSGFLYKSNCSGRVTLTRKTREDFQRFWCQLGQSLLLYQSETSTEPSLQIPVKDILCLGVSRPDWSHSGSSNGFINRFRFTFELYLSSDRFHQFGLESLDALQSWTRTIGKAATPLGCHCLLSREFERVGLLRFRNMLDPQQWKEEFFVLQKSNLFMCPIRTGAAEDIINLNRLQELSVGTEGDEKKEVLILVERGRTLHLQGAGRSDFSLWCSDIRRAAGGSGNTLRDQQMSRNDIPIIVDRCIEFVTQYGLGHEGIYRKNGALSRIKLLMDEFRRDARNVRLRIGDHFIEDVTDVLKRFFREIEDPVFMSHLHPLWQEAAKSPQKAQRLERYKELIRILPRVNRTTLAALVSHLYRVQKCAGLNQMCTKNLALLFAPSLFQTDGKGEYEVKIMEDLINNYPWLFDIDEEHQTQIDLEVSLITSWKDTQLSQAGDLIIEVYLQKKLPDCCVTLKVSPSMCAQELTNQVLYLRNMSLGEPHAWMMFEAVEDGQLERPLRPKEKVLEQVLQWCQLPDPSSAYLVVKKIPKMDGVDVLSFCRSDVIKVGVLKFREEPPKFHQGTKFQERIFQIKDRKLLLLRDKKSLRPEKEWSLDNMKVYMGIRRKLKAPSRFGLTVALDRHQLFLCCSEEAELWDWMTCFLNAHIDDSTLPPVRRRSTSHLQKQKFGTMPLVPIRGNDSNRGMLAANQTLRKLHDRRTLSMFFPMKVQSDPPEESEDSPKHPPPPEQPETPEPPEPLYEEVGDFGLQVLRSLETSFLSGVVSETQEVLDHLQLVSVKPKRTVEDPLDGGPPGGCTTSQELLLQELESAFGKLEEAERQQEVQQDENTSSK